jgi:hypothetical protein
MAGLNAAELADVLPQEAAAYLGATGWRTSTSYAVASVWERDIAGARVEILLPTTSQLDDYPARIADLLRTLAVVEGRSRKDILDELRFPLLDMQQIRTTPPTPSGTTLLHHGYLATKGVHDLFLAAATSVALQDSQPVMPRSKPRAARNFLELVRLGPSGRGSYIIRVQTALNVPSRLANVVQPRTVLLHLYGALKATHDAADDARNTQNIEVFAQQVNRGVSANICEALMDIGGPDNRPFDFQFTWAKPRPVDQPTPKLDFSSDHIAILRQASKYLRSLTTMDRATVRGMVVELKRRSRQTPGKAVIEGVLETAGQATSEQRVPVILPEEFYDLSLQAHRDGRQVFTSGTLRTTRRRAELIDINEFRLL